MVVVDGVVDDTGGEVTSFSDAKATLFFVVFRPAYNVGTGSSMEKQL